MKGLFYLVLALASLTAPAWADWVETARGTDGNSYYVDTKSIKMLGKTVQFRCYAGNLETKERQETKICQTKAGPNNVLLLRTYTDSTNQWTDWVDKPPNSVWQMMDTRCRKFLESGGEY